MANLKFGSTGTEVKDLQQKLIDAGYGDIVGKADGVFGAKTQQAVTEYQKAKGLTVDGIAGKNTLGSLNSANNAGAAVAQGVVNGAKQAAGGNTGGNKGGNAGSNAGSNAGTNAGGGEKKTGSGTPDTTGSSTFTYQDFSYGSYDDMKSDVVKEAEAILAQYGTTKPGDWVDPYKDKYMGYLNQYENRDPFSYDFNNDPLYQQYRDQYVQQGQMAMMDTMGQAAAMTGGYGNSYAQTVGQQAYNQQLGQLNEMMPELYQMAYDRYGEEGQQMLDMFNMYLGLSEQDFAQYQSGLDNWYREYDRLAGIADTEYQRDYNEYMRGYETAYGDYSTGRSEAFSDYQTKQQQEFSAGEAEKDRAFNASESEKDRAFTASENEKSRAASAAKSSGGGNPTDTGKTTMSQTDQQTYKKNADRAFADKGLDGLYEIGEQLEFEGYSQAFIEKWIASEIERLSPKPKKTPETQPTGVAGGGGGGTWYLETR